MENKDEHMDFLDSGVLAPFKKWATKWSLWPVHFVTSCCGVELAHAFGCGYDGERIGALNFGIARQTNFIVVEGTITRKMARALRQVWEQMPDPKFVSVIGACGERGGIFWNGYNIIRPYDVVPVDFFVPGCPSTPEGILRGVRAVQDKLDGKDRTTIEFKNVGLPSEEGKENRVPTTPKIYSPTPAIKVDVRRDADWGTGKELVERLKGELNGLYKSITITGKNRIAIKTTTENVAEIASKMSNGVGIDHVKNVNVIDVPHERKMIVEYMASSYAVKEFMPVLITIFADIRRDECKFPSLTQYWENADYSEREMHEFFGVWFEGNSEMGRKFLLAPDTPEFPLRKDFKLKEEMYAFEEGKVVPSGISAKPATEISELPLPLPEGFLEDAENSDELVVLVGPHHPGSGHARWVVRLKGDIITEVLPDVGYVHRSMEKLAENRLYIQNIPLFERASITDFGNINLGYVRAIENALGIEVPERAKYIRTVIAEVSRISAFFYDSAIAAMMLGHSTGFMYAFALREMIVELVTRMTGARITASFIVPGGVRRDIPADVLETVGNLQSAVQKRWKKFEDIFINNPVTIARLKGTGVLTKEEAIKYGVVGPFLRASGVEYDVRKVEPYEAYDRLNWDVPISDDGDALSRFLVRVEEMKQSLSIIRQAVDALKNMKGGVLSEELLGDYKDASTDIRGYFYRVFGDIVIPKGEWTSITEAARGSLIYSLISDGESNVPYRVRIVTPSWLNLKGYMESLKGSRLADLQALFQTWGYFPPEADR